MRLLTFIALLISYCTFSQNKISTELIAKQDLDVDQLIMVDNFDSKFYIDDNTFYKNSTITNELNYANVQLGQINSADVFNPLKMNLFYKDFNTLVVLDNRLAEITKVDFNAVNPLRIVTHISSGNDNTIWLFNQNTLQLELFDYLFNKTRITTLPVTGKILDIESNYTHCWLVTDAFIYKYNYTGSIISKIENNGFSKVRENNENLFLLKDKTIYYKPKDSNEIQELITSELLIKQFLVTNETLYIYNEGILHRYQLKTE